MEREKERGRGWRKKRREGENGGRKGERGRIEGRKERGRGWREERREGGENRGETQRRRGKVRGACNQIVQCHRMQRLGCGGDLVVCWKTQSLFQPPRLKTAAAKILTPLSDSSVDKERTPSHTVHGYLRTCRQYLRAIKVLVLSLLHD